jgi:hypothetical protein
MSKLKKLWKVLAGSVSWNFKAPENNAGAVKSGKKERAKGASHEDFKDGLTAS